MFSIIIRLPKVSNPDALRAAIYHSLPRTARVTSGINRILCVRKGVGASGIHRFVAWRHRHEPVIGRNDCLLHLLVMNLTNVGSAAGVVHPPCRTSGHDENGYCEHYGMCGPGPHDRTTVTRRDGPGASAMNSDGNTTVVSTTLFMPRGLHKRPRTSDPIPPAGPARQTAFGGRGPQIATSARNARHADEPHNSAGQGF